MPDGSSVRPHKWDRIQNLFDNGEYSVISGLYDGGNRRVLGTRWNGQEGELGFPSIAGNPVWQVVPEFLAVALLQGLLIELAGSPNEQDREYIDRIRRELNIQFRLQNDLQ